MPLWETWGSGLDAQRKAIRKRLEKANLADRADAILDAARVSAGLRFKPLETKPAPIGVSRAGGEPDLPSRVEWPEKQSFLLQINLADLANIPLTTPLPKTGLLSFFVDDDADADNEYLTDCTVLYSANAKALARARRTKQSGTKIPARRVEIVPYLSLAQSNSAEIAALKLNADEKERYADDVYRKTPEPRYRVGGHDADYYAPQEVKSSFVLLALSSSDAMSFFWGDADKCYFYLPKTDWQKADFSDASSRCATA